MFATMLTDTTRTRHQRGTSRTRRLHWACCITDELLSVGPEKVSPLELQVVRLDLEVHSLGDLVDNTPNHVKIQTKIFKLYSYAKMSCSVGTCFRTRQGIPIKICFTEKLDNIAGGSKVIRNESSELHFSMNIFRKAV